MATSAAPLPNLGPDVDRGANVAATYIVGCAVTFIVLVLRFWARYTIRGLAIDDWCMLITWVRILHPSWGLDGMLTGSRFHSFRSLS